MRSRFCSGGLKALKMTGHLAMGGQVTPRLCRAQATRHGRGEEGDQGRRCSGRWKDKPTKLAQEDRDARWTVRWHAAGRSRQSERADGLGLRTIGNRQGVKIGLANLAYSMRRFIWLDGRNAPAAAAGTTVRKGRERAQTSFRFRKQPT
jgi:hypothetical protein